MPGSYRYGRGRRPHHPASRSQAGAGRLCRPGLRLPAVSPSPRAADRVTGAWARARHEAGVARARTPWRLAGGSVLRGAGGLVAVVGATCGELDISHSTLHAGRCARRRHQYRLSVLVGAFRCEAPLAAQPTVRGWYVSEAPHRPRAMWQMFRFASWPASPLLHWRCRLDRVGDACGRSSAVTRRCRGSASSARRMGSAGRHQARGRWRAVLARHRWYAVFGAGAGTAALAGVVMISLPHHSPSSNADCGRVTCAGTLPPVSAPASPHGRQPARLAISAAP